MQFFVHLPCHHTFLQTEVQVKPFVSFPVVRFPPLCMHMPQYSLLHEQCQQDQGCQGHFHTKESGCHNLLAKIDT